TNEMNSISFKEFFALGVRLLGLWLVVRGFQYVEGFVDSKLYPLSDRLGDRGASHLIYATFDFALAAFFLFWTNVIVAWTYGDNSQALEESAADEEKALGSPPSESPT